MPSAVKPPQTLYDKVFEDHIVDEKDDGTILLYIGTYHAVLLFASSLTAAQTGILFTK
jgi:hypothetical protein